MTTTDDLWHDAADSHREQLQHAAVNDAITDIKSGETDKALRELTASVLGAQARAAGIRVMPRD